MKAYLPKKPVGNSPKWMFLIWVWELLAGGKFPLRGDGDVVVSWEHGFYRIKTKPSRGGGSSSFPWQSPKELDPRVAVAKDTFVYISPGNALATTGLMDLVANRVIPSPAGIWQAVKSVPAQVVVGGVTKYNVPQLPYPGAAGGAAGTPLKGDLDGVNVFWVQWSGAPLCF